MSTNIEVSCSTCGTINRIAESDLPAGAKFVSCASCKSRVALPPIKASRPPPLPAGPSGGAGSSIGLSDLPAPKRNNPLGNAEPSRPAPRSAIAQADLPMPRGGRQQPPSAPPVTASGSFDLDDLLPADGGAELPVPKVGGSRPASDVSDLPAPRASAPPVKSRAMTDLPMPGISDLPAPAAPKIPPVRAPAASVADLPAPRSGAGIVDLPAPRGGISDLPAPVARGGVTDLPAPRGNPPGIVDLPAPRAGGGVVDLPTPRAEVPAPKGFFDDLPQPARTGAQTKNDLPAPKGFFDDLPGRVNSSKPEVPAPKGFFDDLPGRVNTAKAAASAAPEVPAPKGFFDDLPGRPTGNAPQPPAPKGFFDDLPQPTSPTKPSVPAPRAEKPSNLPVELNLETSSPALDLGLATSNEGSVARKYDDLDLSQPSTGIRIETPKTPPADARAHTPSVQPLPAFKKDRGPAPPLELEEPRDILPRNQSQQLGPKKKEAARALDPDAARARAKRVRVFALVGLLVVAFGGAGFFLYSKWSAKRAAANLISDEIAKAKDALTKSDKMHWDRASAAANQVLQEDQKHGEALAVGAEGMLGSALATGVGYTAKVSGARGFIQRAVGENIAGPNLIRAQALSAITTGNGMRAVELLKTLATPDSKDATLHLYLGWAYAAHSDPVNAIKSFDQAATLGTEYIKISAIYGRAQAKLEQADIEGATADFKAVYELDKEHIGAQVGLAAAYPASKSQEQEKELLALFERKDFVAGDPRAQVKAWVLAAEAAKRGNRLDVARERYRKALEVLADDLSALAGAADVELRDGKLDAAADQISKALAISKDDIRSQLVQSEISIAKKELSDARARIEALSTRNPTPPKLDLARIKMAAGNLANAESKDEDAAAAYEEAALLAGDTDMAPTLAAVGKLTLLSDKATNEGDAPKATGYKERATKLLEKLEAQADKDPSIALSLGMAYLRTGDALKAEPWLRKFVEARPDDAEGQFQLAKALARLDRTDDAITRLNRAIELAPKRPELSIELALTYERAKQDDKANDIYTKLLAAQGADASVELRARAGRFFSRRGDKKKAGEQGDEILKVAKNHTAGSFLKAEGLLEQNQLDEARLLFGRAAAAERDALYFDGLGRANEAKAVASNESKYQQLAIDAYKTATSLDDKLVASHAGMGRMYMLRKEYDLAVVPLDKAYKLDQTDPNVPFLIGLAYFQQKEKSPDLAKAAVTWLKISNALKPSAEVNYRLGLLYRETDPKAAAAALETAMDMALKDERDNGDAWAKKNMPWLHDLLYQAGDALNATQNLKRAAFAWDAFLGHAPDSRQFQVQIRNAQRELTTGLSAYRKQ
jgi:Flp pilus assembly protein TadD